MLDAMGNTVLVKHAATTGPQATAGKLTRTGTTKVEKGRIGDTRADLKKIIPGM
jgi:hypothetical protein